MSWLQQLGGLLGQYVGADPQQAPPSAHQDFSHLAQAVPQHALAEGIAHAFQSDQTPPFGQMVGQLFGQADPHQQSGLLNTLLQAAGPALTSQALSGSGLSGLAGFLGGSVPPQQAAQIPPQAVEQLAGMAMQQDPSIVHAVSGFVSQQPGLFQSLGAGALTAALSGLAQQHQGGGGVLPASMDPMGDPADQGYR
jgi:hypothetical protein